MTEEKLAEIEALGRDYGRGPADMLGPFEKLWIACGSMAGEIRRLKTLASAAANDSRVIAKLEEFIINHCRQSELLSASPRCDACGDECLPDTRESWPAVWSTCCGCGKNNGHWFDQPGIGQPAGSAESTAKAVRAYDEYRAKNPGFADVIADVLPVKRQHFGDVLIDMMPLRQAVSQLAWTETPPTETGWYWWRPLNCSQLGPPCRCSRCLPDVYDIVIDADRGAMIDDPDFGFKTVAQFGCGSGQWAGPLKPPS